MNQDLASLLAGLAPKVAGHRPWPRHILDRKGWLDLLGQLEGADYPLLGLWGDGDMVHLALRDGPSAAVASLPCPDRRYPAVSPCRPAAARLERVARDLFGLEAEGAADVRPWLDHGRWPRRRPKGAEPGIVTATAYEFLAAEAQGAVLHQIPVGPIHAGIIEPGHFRFHVNGETVVRLEARLGYTHKGIEPKMADKTPAEAARLASRISGDSAVGHSLAFAHAVEAALEVVAPPRAHFLRALMAELERLANHFGDIGAICNDATFPLLLAHFSALREQVLRAAQSCFGHRLMMDCIVPGGVAVDLNAAGTGQLAELVRDLRPRLAELVRVYDSKSSLLDRMVLTGIVKTELVHRFGAGGYIGRASGNGHDARRNPGYSPHAEDAGGVPISALVFGGRRREVAPLVYEARDWKHGVLVGASLASETTAAAVGQVGVTRRDPMAMQPFCGYNFGDYWQHWLNIGAQLARPPRIYHVNWFRRDAHGKFLWPGYGENLRVLAWMLDRCAGKAGASESAVGWLPRPADLDTRGLNVGADALAALLTVDPTLWRKELGELREYLGRYGSRLPAALLAELESTERRLA